MYTKIDIRAAYNHIRIKQGDEWKTAFQTQFDLFEYMVMPFGLVNASASFQGYIHWVLRDFLDIFCLAYLDDLLIYLNNEQDHVQHVR